MMHYWICIWRQITSQLTTWIAFAYATLWGISIGKGNRFLGLPIIRRYPGSSIAIGDGCRFISSTHYNFIGVNHPCVISTHNSEAKISIGDDCGFSGTAIGCALDIRMGDRVRCGANTIITDTDWHTDDPRTTENAPVVIEDDVWLGANVVILKGVTVGKSSVIGVGSVVTSDIPPGVVAAGMPARILRPLSANLQTPN